MTSNAPPSSPATTHCFRRGSQWLTASELEAHLAAALRLENVGVFLGAGSSLEPLGGLTVPQLWNYFQEHHAPSVNWLRQENFISSEESVDLEQLLDDLEVTRLEWKRIGRSELADLTSVRADLFRTVVQGSLLEPKWWTCPSALYADPKPLANHRGLLQKLTAARQPGQPSPWLFTSNYDLAIEWAAETLGLKVTNGFDGLHRRVFSSHNFHLGYRNTLARGEARFGTYNIYLAKLHGSLTWQLARDGTVQELPAHALWDQVTSFLSGDSDDLESLIVYPSIAKYVSTVGAVLGELLRRFTEFLARPQTCLIVSGYSFSDEHLNSVLASALQNPTLQLVLYCPEATRTGDALTIDACTDWFQRVVGLESPRVTVVGGGPEAFFEAMVKHLPDPAVYDEQAAKIRAMIKEYSDFLKGASGGCST